MGQQTGYVAEPNHGLNIVRIAPNMTQEKWTVALCVIAAEIVFIMVGFSMNAIEALILAYLVVFLTVEILDRKYKK